MGHKSSRHVPNDGGGTSHEGNNHSKVGGGGGKDTTRAMDHQTVSTSSRCLLCDPSLRDPLTVALSFMTNPAPFIGTCTFSRGVWDQAVYLEGDLPCPYLTWSSRCGTVKSNDTGAPSLEGRIRNLMSHPDRWWNLHVVNTTNVGIPVPGGEEELILEMKHDEPRITTFASFGGFGQTGTLRSVLLMNLPHITSIDVLAFSQCGALTSVTMTRLQNLRKIGNGFCSQCTVLKEVKLTDLPKLSEIGKNFLDGNSVLEVFSLVNLPMLESIGRDFLSRCARLKEVRLEYLPELQTVDGDWLVGVPSGIALCLKELPKLHTLGDRGVGQQELEPFSDASVVDCPALTEFSLKKLKHVGGVH